MSHHQTAVAMDSLTGCKLSRLPAGYVNYDNDGCNCVSAARHNDKHVLIDYRHFYDKGSNVLALK